MNQQYIGFTLFAGIMSVLWTSFGTALDESGDAPDEVWAIMVVLTALYLSFGILSLSYARGSLKESFATKNFRKVEVGFIILSFVAKTFLLNMVLFGSMRDRNPDTSDSTD